MRNIKRQMRSQDAGTSVIAPMIARMLLPDPVYLLRPLSHLSGIVTILGNDLSTRFRRRTHLPDPQAEESFRRRVAHGPPRTVA